MNTNSEEKFVVPAATLTEQPEGYELTVYVPGIAKEDAELHMAGHTLTLKTHAKHQNPAGFKLVASEYAYANYAMSADLPEMADAMAKDKKAGGGQVAFILLKRPGEVEIVPLDVARVCE